ncbi:MAG: hypothetical protein AB7U05_06145 [Mangrovibacterium sp.]
MDRKEEKKRFKQHEQELESVALVAHFFMVNPTPKELHVHHRQCYWRQTRTLPPGTLKEFNQIRIVQPASGLRERFYYALSPNSIGGDQWFDPFGIRLQREFSVASGQF